MNIQIMARNPTDHFTWQFFEWCVNQIPESDQIYYIWAEPFEKLESMIDIIDCRSQRIWLFVSDNLCLYDFNPWEQNKTWGAQVLRKKILQHPQIKFVIYSDVINLNLEFQDLANVDILTGDYLTMDQPGWQRVKPIISKSLSSSKHWISLNHRPAAHRVSSASYIIGQGLDAHGRVIVSSKFLDHINKYDNYLDMVGWHFNNQQEYELKPYLLDGFQKLKSWTDTNDDYDQKNPINQFGNNFAEFLSPLYDDTCVEIVQETYYAEPNFMCTEKFLNSVHGCNFPIVLNSAGAIGHLEEIGFDVFRDVVDQRYDLIKNPFTRLQEAFDSNRRLLTDKDYAKQHWLNHHDRLISNAEFARQQMYDVIWQRLTDKFKQIV